MRAGEKEGAAHTPSHQHTPPSDRHMTSQFSTRLRAHVTDVTLESQQSCLSNSERAAETGKFPSFVRVPAIASAVRQGQRLAAQRATLNGSLPAASALSRRRPGGSPGPVESRLERRCRLGRWRRRLTTRSGGDGGGGGSGGDGGSSGVTPQCVRVGGGAFKGRVRGGGDQSPAKGQRSVYEGSVWYRGVDEGGGSARAAGRRGRRCANHG